MSIITFKCANERKEEIKEKCFDILHTHYLKSVFPNTRVDYNDEGVGVYSERLKTLMKENLCKIEDVEDCVRVEFDSTEDAGFMIASSVYGTGMGYSDNGLTFLKPVFDAFIEQMPDICFEGECECSDKWVCEEYTCSYDGEHFECDAEWMDCEE